MKLTIDTLHLYAEASGNCLLWKQGRNSYGPIANIDGKPQGVRRYVCHHLMNVPVLPGMVVTARCLDRMCISPRCLFIRPRAEIIRETNARMKKSLDGKMASYPNRLRAVQKQGLTKLDIEKAREIRRCAAEGVGRQELARRFGVAPKTVSRVIRGASWLEPGSVFGTGLVRPQTAA